MKLLSHPSRFFLVVLLLFVGNASAWAAELTAMRVWEDPDETRLVLEFDTPVKWKHQTLHKPERVVLDLLETTKSSKLSIPSLPEGSVIKGVRTGRHNSITRIVLDLKQMQPHDIERLPAAGIYGPRLLVRLTDKKQKTAKTKPKPSSKPVKTTSGRPLLVMIDAGHGGEDPGAIGRGKVYEKHITLALAKALKKAIEAHAGFKAVLTRPKDYYIPLRQRTLLAKQQDVDFFISVHADSFTSSKPRGASVFALSRRGATSEMGRVLARKENQSDLVAGFSEQSAYVKATLLDFMLDGTISESKQAGNLVLKELKKVTKLHSKRVEQAGFVVLKNPNLPSLLIEAGFISNPQDRKNLQSKAHRKKLATAIAKGVTQYFYQNPIEGSYVWAKQYGQPLTHKVRSGDSLSLIAQRYGVSVSGLKRINGLKSGIIHPGQTLVIPGI